MSTHYLSFCREIRKILYRHPLLPGAMYNILEEKKITGKKITNE